MSRSERKTRYCGYCPTALPENAHPSQEYCNARCRRLAFVERGHVGRIGSVRRLQSGKTSVTIHMKADLGLKPGDVLTFAKAPVGERQP